MLVLSRCVGEQIIVGKGKNQIVITLVGILGSDKARIGVAADPEIPIDRREIAEQKGLIEAKKASADGPPPDSGVQ